jgi:hypothetical protein
MHAPAQQVVYGFALRHSGFEVMTDNSSYFGQKGLADATSFYNTLVFMIRQELAKVRTSIPVKVIAVHGGGVGPPPTVDVQPLVNQTDGQGNSTPHGIIYGIPVHRCQGGTGAIINDPQVGDVGHMTVHDRDISSVKANNGAQSNPGSMRRHDMADGSYAGAMPMGVTPTTYIHYRSDGGVEIIDSMGNKIVTQAGTPAVYIEPASGGMLYLGGDGTEGSYAFVQTVSGPSTNVKARFA